MTNFRFRRLLAGAGLGVVLSLVAATTLIDVAVVNETIAGFDRAFAAVAAEI